MEACARAAAAASATHSAWGVVCPETSSLPDCCRFTGRHRRLTGTMSGNKRGQRCACGAPTDRVVIGRRSIGTAVSGASAMTGTAGGHTVRTAPALDIDAILDDPGTRIVVCCGSGGVGKTTTAAALGLRAAERGRRVVVLTVDPARRLAQSMGLTELDNTPRQIGRAAWRARR